MKFLGIFFICLGIIKGTIALVVSKRGHPNWRRRKYLRWLLYAGIIVFFLGIVLALLS